MEISEDKDAQENELLALSSIYNDDEFQRAGSQGGEIRICLELPADFKVTVKEEPNTQYDVCFLPPLFLNFKFPSNYPSTSAPIFHLSSMWMTKVQLSTLCRRLDELWEENQSCVVLFTWIQFLKEETLDFLHIQSPLKITRNRKPDLATSSEKTEVKKNVCLSELDQRAIILMDPHTDPLSNLLLFNETQRQRVFDQKVFQCGVCFLQKRGSDCICFRECQHVYCKACMTQYFKTQIRDGNVQSLNCPELKCSSSATPAQVKELVDEKSFARFDRLLLQSTLNLMPDVVYCPRPHCGSAVMLEPDASVGICPICHYAFCPLCKLGYHGVSWCKIPAKELLKLKDEYLSATSSGKTFLEKRFGKRLIQKAVDESFSNEWLAENSKSCPQCGTNIQKVDGCNKMTCTSCQHFFCWLCLGVLSRANPYAHFNDPNSPCHNQLFHGVVEDDDEVF